MGEGYNDKESDIAINSKLDNNIRFLAEKFDSWCDIVKKRFELSRMGRAYSVYIMYIDGLADDRSRSAALLTTVNQAYKFIREYLNWVG